MKERDAAVLECEVPDETVQTAWYLEDQRLMPSSKYAMEQKGTRRRLTIHDVGTDDDGVYLCEMPNGAKSIAELSVKGRLQLHYMSVIVFKNSKPKKESHLSQFHYSIANL